MDSKRQIPGKTADKSKSRHRKVRPGNCYNIIQYQYTTTQLQQRTKGPTSRGSGKGVEGEGRKQDNGETEGQDGGSLEDFMADDSWEKEK